MNYFIFTITTYSEQKRFNYFSNFGLYSEESHEKLNHESLQSNFSRWKQF